MTFGAVFAAILAMLAAGDEPHGAAAPAEAAAPETQADARPLAPAAPSSGEARDDAAAPDPPAGEEPEPEAAPAEAPDARGAALARAPDGAPLADSGPILLDRAARPDGSALERLVEPSGEIVEHDVNRAGTVRSCRTVGTLFTLRVLEERPAAGGEVIEVVRDASGALLRVVVAADGDPRAVALLAPPPR